MARNAVNQFSKPVLRHDACFNRRTTAWKLIKDRTVHFTISREREAARNRRCRHDQQMRNAPALARQHEPLGDAETMLLVDNGNGERLVGHGLLENRMRANEDVDRTVSQPHQRCFAQAALFAAR